MSDDRERRVKVARDKLLLAAEETYEESTILADAILMAAFEILMRHFQDRNFVCVLFENAARRMRSFKPKPISKTGGSR